jgi:hypothetical protein
VEKVKWKQLSRVGIGHWLTESSSFVGFLFFSFFLSELRIIVSVNC